MRLAALAAVLLAGTAFAAPKKALTPEQAALPPAPEAPKPAAAPSAPGMPVKPSPVVPARKGPPRPAEKGCAWKLLSSPEIGLELQVQSCDFGFRTIEFGVGKRALIQSMTDKGKKPDLFPVIVMYEKKEGEGPDEAIRRAVFGKLTRYERKHCRVVAKAVAHMVGADKSAFTIEPDETYAEAHGKKYAGEVPPPPCGDMGTSFDGISYFEFHDAENPRRFAFVNAGQDTPLFDETGLKFLP